MEFETNHEIIVRARRNANGAVWDYLAGGSETETSMRRNRQALDSIVYAHVFSEMFPKLI